MILKEICCELKVCFKWRSAHSICGVWVLKRLCKSTVCMFKYDKFFRGCSFYSAMYVNKWFHTIRVTLGNFEGIGWRRKKMLLFSGLSWQGWHVPHFTVTVNNWIKTWGEKSENFAKCKIFIYWSYCMESLICFN